jgi:hypothetical protein
MGASDGDTLPANRNRFVHDFPLLATPDASGDRPGVETFVKRRSIPVGSAMARYPRAIAATAAALPQEMPGNCSDLPWEKNHWPSIQRK